MGQPSERLAAVARLREGKIEETPFAAILAGVAISGKSAVIELHRTPFEKQIILEEGVPVDCRSNLAHETFGRFLVNTGKLTESDFNATLTEAASRGMPHGEVLIDRGLISPSDLFRMLQQCLARKLLDPFTWKAGTFAISYDVPEVESPLKVRVPQLVLTGITKFANQEEIDRAMNPLIGKTLVRHPDPPFDDGEIRLSQAQSAIVEALGPGRRVDEIAVATGLDFDTLGRALYALVALDLVVPSDAVPAGAKPTEAPRPRPAAAPAQPVPVTPAPAASTEDVAQVENRLMKLYLSFRKLDAFDLFGLDETARPAEIDERWLEYAKTWAPWSLPGAASKLGEKARELFNAGARAYAQLASDEQRLALVTRRRTLREEAAKAPARDRFRIKTDLLDSEQQFRKGKSLMDAGRYQEALSFLEFASDCDPQSGLYRAELAYCRFLQSPMIVTGSSSLDELREAMRIDPECGLSWYYAGLIQKQLGRTAEAEELLRSAIKRMAPDRRPIDALKDLTRR